MVAVEAQRMSRMIWPMVAWGLAYFAVHSRALLIERQQIERRNRQRRARMRRRLYGS